MKHLFIINPAAGSRDRTAKYSEQIHTICHERDLDYEIKVSQAPGNCRELAKAAAETGEEYRIYACGGDGTLNEVVSGVAGYDNVAVTVFSGGSGNDFAKVFDDPDAFRDLEKLLDCKEVTFDLIRCNEFGIRYREFLRPCHRSLLREQVYVFICRHFVCFYSG